MRNKLISVEETINLTIPAIKILQTYLDDIGKNLPKSYWYGPYLIGNYTNLKRGKKATNNAIGQIQHLSKQLTETENNLNASLKQIVAIKKEIGKLKSVKQLIKLLLRKDLSTRGEMTEIIHTTDIDLIVADRALELGLNADDLFMLGEYLILKPALDRIISNLGEKQIELFFSSPEQNPNKKYYTFDPLNMLKRAKALNMPKSFYKTVILNTLNQDDYLGYYLKPVYKDKHTYPKVTSWIESRKRGYGIDVINFCLKQLDQNEIQSIIKQVNFKSKNTYAFEYLSQRVKSVDIADINLMEAALLSEDLLIKKIESLDKNHLIEELKLLFFSGEPSDSNPSKSQLDVLPIILKHSRDKINDDVILSIILGLKSRLNFYGYDDMPGPSESQINKYFPILSKELGSEKSNKLSYLSSIGEVPCVAAVVEHNKKVDEKRRGMKTSHWVTP